MSFVYFYLLSTSLRKVNIKIKNVHSVIICWEQGARRRGGEQFTILFIEFPGNMEHRGQTNTKWQLRPDTEAGNHRTYKHWGTCGNKTQGHKSDNYSPLSKRDNPLHATSNREGGWPLWRPQGTRSRAMAEQGIQEAKAGPRPLRL